MKTCTKCSASKDDSEFTVKKSGKLASWCKLCTGKQIEEYRKNNKSYSDRKRLLKHKRADEIRMFVIDFLKENPCVDCGEKDPVVLDFDHMMDKEFNISDAVHGHYGLKTIVKEISKCEVRCANCHRRKTSKERNFFKNRLCGLEKCLSRLAHNQEIGG